MGKESSAGSDVILKAENLRKSFGGQTVLDNISFELREGEVVLLRGENGSGKTTLLNILTGHLEPDSGEIHYRQGEKDDSSRFPLRWWQKLNPWDHFTPEYVARRRIGRTWQDVRLFGTHSLRDNIAVAHPRQPGERPWRALFSNQRSREHEHEVLAEADRVLTDLGLAERSRSSGDKVSLGQSKRVAIARALAADVRILFLDEPLGGLDRKGINEVVDLLRKLVHGHGVTLVIVEHVFHLPHLESLATTDWYLREGRIESQKLDKPTRKRQRPPIPPATSRPHWISRLAPNGYEILDEPLVRGAALTRIRPKGFPARPGAPLIEVKNLVIRRGQHVLQWDDGSPSGRGLSLTIHQGELVVLQAPNGWGKTSLLEAVAGLLCYEAGVLRLDGASLNGQTPWERALLGIALVRARDNVFPSLTAGENLRLAGLKRLPDQLKKLEDRPAADLSGGQKQKVALSSSNGGGRLGKRPPARVLLLDEPFSMLDRAAILELLTLIAPNMDRGTLVAIPATSLP